MKERSDTASAMPATYAGEPAIGVAHGSLLLPGGSTSPATPLFARVAQHYYLERLLGEASPAVREELQTRSQPVEGDTREFIDNALLIAQLIERVQPADASDLTSINKFIAKEMAGDLAAELGLIASSQRSRESYRDACLNAGVPIPPDWNPEANDLQKRWKKQSIPPTPIFIGAESTTATVWYYESTAPDPVGTCIALPRADSNGVIKSLGVICQGYEKACFWDNTRDIQPDAKVAILSDAFNAGPDLDGGIGGKCTDCHRGENAYIVHPDSSLNLAEPPVGLSMFGQTWVTPIVHDAWFKNPAPEDGHDFVFDCLPRVSGERCSASCHSPVRPGKRLGQLGGEHSKYCDFVIMPTILPGDRKTMPRVGESLNYRTDQEGIAKACGWDVAALGFPPRDPDSEIPTIDPGLCSDPGGQPADEPTVF